jgi:hypothetical protein
VFVKEGDSIIYHDGSYHALIYEILRCKDVFNGVEIFCRNLSKLSTQLHARIKPFLEGPTQKLILDLLPRIEEYLEQGAYLSPEDVMRFIREHREIIGSVYPYPWTCTAYYVETPKLRRFFEFYLHQSLVRYRQWLE